MKFLKLLKNAYQPYQRRVTVGYWMLALSVIAPCLLFIWIDDLQVLYLTPFLSSLGFLVFGIGDDQDKEKVKKLKTRAYCSIFVMMLVQMLFLWLLLNNKTLDALLIQGNNLNNPSSIKTPTNPMNE